jgi:hypothetical protein
MGDLASDVDCCQASQCRKTCIRTFWGIVKWQKSFSECFSKADNKKLEQQDQ